MPRNPCSGRRQKPKKKFVQSNLEYYWKDWREENELIEMDLEKEWDWKNSDFNNFSVDVRPRVISYNEPTIYSYLTIFVGPCLELIQVWTALGYHATKRFYSESKNQNIVGRLLREAWLEVAGRLKFEPERQLPKLIHAVRAHRLSAQELKNLFADPDDSLDNAEEIFPERVWKLILHQMPDWRDMQNCSKACNLFRKILRPFTVQFRFPDVFPWLHKYLTGYEILKCRIVCKAWCEGVDHASHDSDPSCPPFFAPMEEIGLYLKSRLAKQNIVKRLVREAWLEVADRLKLEPEWQLSNSMQEVKTQNGSAQQLKNMIVDEMGADLDNANEIFPEEVWEMILLNMLPDWKNMRNCSKACKLFGKIFGPFAVQFWFPDIFPSLYKYLDGAEILKSRTVCKAWCEGVDCLFENHASLRPYDSLDSDPRRILHLTPMEEKGLHLNARKAAGEDDDDEDEYIRDFDWAYGLPRRPFYLPDNFIPGRNPFIGRAVLINIRWNQRTMEKVLELYGEHIWYLTIEWEYWMEAEESNLDFLLEHTPNLRKLRLINPHPRYGSSFDDHRQLSPISSLETLQFDKYCRGSRFFALFHSYHMQLKRIHMLVEDWSLLYNLDWPSLTELHLNRLNGWIDMSLDGIPNTKSKFGNSLLQASMPNLRKLSCGKQKFTWGGQDLSPAWNYCLNGYGLTFMLAVIVKMSRTTRLNTFCFRFTEHISTRHRESSPRHTLEEDIIYAPPSIKTLEVEHFFDFKIMTSYSFLKHFPFLENLNVFLRKVFYDDELPNFRREDAGKHMKDILSFWGKLGNWRRRRILDSEIVEVNSYLYTGKMYKSNIWKVLPRLKVFTFQLDTMLQVYTRDGYEKFSKQ